MNIPFLPEYHLKVKEGDLIAVGSVLCDGHIDLRKLYEVMGREAVHRYIIREIEEIYASQGEGINDKHIEVIIRQMMSRLRIVDPGDSMLLPAMSSSAISSKKRTMRCVQGE